MRQIVPRARWLAILTWLPSFAATALAEDRLSDIPAAVAAIASEGKVISFAEGGQHLPTGGHLQGIQWRRDAAQQLAFLSHDSHSVAYFLVVRIGADTADGEPMGSRVVHLQPLPSDGQQPPLRHAGGIQLLGDVLVVGVEDNQDKKRSEVQFWDTHTPNKPTQLAHLTIQRRSEQPKEMTAGAVGLVAREHDHLLAVANWDSRAIDLYISNGKSLDDPLCRFTLHVRWQAETSSKTSWRPDQYFGTYQAINLVADSERRIYLLGFDTTPAGQDIVDLFSLDLKASAVAMLRKLDRRQIKLFGDNHFRFAGGVSAEGGRLKILSGPREVAPQTRLNVVR